MLEGDPLGSPFLCPVKNPGYPQGTPGFSHNNQNVRETKESDCIRFFLYMAILTLPRFVRLCVQSIDWRRTNCVVKVNQVKTTSQDLATSIVHGCINIFYFFSINALWIHFLLLDLDINQKQTTMDYLNYLRQLAVSENVFHQDSPETNSFKFYVNFNAERFAKVLKINGLAYNIEHQSEELTVFVVGR